MEVSQKKSVWTIIVNVFFLLVLNMVLMFIIGYMTLDSAANINSRVGAFLASIFIPLFIVLKTNKMNDLERMLKFGLGFIAYIILALFMVGFPHGFLTGLLPCLVIALAVLFYGRELFKIS